MRETHCFRSCRGNNNARANLTDTDNPLTTITFFHLKQETGYYVHFKNKTGGNKKKKKEMTLLFFKLFAVPKRETRESHIAPEMPGSLETKLADCPPKVTSRFFFSVPAHGMSSANLIEQNPSHLTLFSMMHVHTVAAHTAAICQAGRSLSFSQ